MYKTQNIAETDRQICEYLHVVFLTIAWKHGLGRHFDSLTPAAQQLALKYIIAGVELFAIVTCVFGRISFCTFLLYIIGPTQRMKRQLLWTVIAVQVVANLVCLVQIYTQCGNHVLALWDFRIAATAHCQSPMVQTVIGYGWFTPFIELRALY